MFLVKGVLKICSKFTGEHPCRSVVSMKLLCNFVEITLRYGCSPVNLLHIFITPFSKNNSGWLLLYISLCSLLMYIYHSTWRNYTRENTDDNQVFHEGMFMIFQFWMK